MPNVSDHLGDAHQHLEQRVSELVKRLAAGELQEAQQATALVTLEILKHMKEEEELVFPLLSSRLLLVPRTTAMVSQHRRIVAQLEDLGEAVDGGEVLRARRSAEDLLLLVEAHHRDELTQLYGWADVLLEPAARARLIRAIGSAAT